MNGMDPRLSVIIPTFNNLEVLKRCLVSWERLASDQPVELLVVEDGCTDGTADYLRAVAETPWGRTFLRWFHEDDVNQVRCNNRGFAEARAPLFLVWDDDMFLEVRWFVPELLDTFDAYPDLGLLSLIRGLNLFPLRYPIEKWADLHDPRHMVATIGEGPLNWLRLTEVDIVIRPWVVRRGCIDKVGPLDVAFCPIEWDEADLAYRLREGGWKAATHCYERLGAFTHLGSITLGKLPSEKHQAMVLSNGELFHQRWAETVRRQHPRRRKTWWRRIRPASLAVTATQVARVAGARALRRLGSGLDRGSTSEGGAVRAFARALGGLLGRDSALVRALRPAYNRFLHVAGRGRGVWWTVNGRERFRIDPALRQYFPPEYKPVVHAYLRERVTPGSVVLDVGANLGIYVLCLAEWIGPQGRVFAFEPDPATRRALERHVVLNGFEDRVTVMREAVSDAIGEATFNATGIEGFSRLGVQNPDLPGGTTITVPVTTIDAFCEREGIFPDWIVLDIDGYEAAALRGGRATLEKRPGLIVEMHPSLWAASNTSREEMEALLAELGLHPAALTGQSDALGEYGLVSLEPTGMPA